MLPVLEVILRLRRLSIAVVRTHRRAGDELAVDSSPGSFVIRGHGKGELAWSIGTDNDLRHGRRIGCRLGDRIGVLEFDRRDTGGRRTRRVDPLALKLVATVTRLAYRCRDPERAVAVIRHDDSDRMDRLVVRIALRLFFDLAHRIGERLSSIILRKGEPTRGNQAYGLGGIRLDVCSLVNLAALGNAKLVGRGLVGRFDGIVERALR